MNKLFDFVINKPKFVLIVSLLLIIPSALGYIFTGINYDILTYLPDTLDSVKGEKIIAEDYNLGSFTMVLIENPTLKNCNKIKKEILNVKNVKNVLWTDNFSDIGLPASILPDEIKNIFYSENSYYGLMFIQFDKNATSLEIIDSVNTIKKTTAKNCLLSGLTPISADTNELTNKELPLYIILAVILAMAVLFLTIDSFILPIVIFLVLMFAVIYNMGSNIFLGEISYITKCIAAVLQLGVTMDYSIFLVNRYKEEKLFNSDTKSAMRNALNSSVSSITGSSMTTVFGFLALCFMQLTLGFNIGIVMAKGVILGLFSVFTVLPSFILVLDNRLFYSRHKVLSLSFDRPVNFVIRNNKVFVWIFILLFIPSLFLSTKVNKYYNLTSTLPDDFDSIRALNVLKDEFNMNSTHFLVTDDSISSEKIVDMEKKLSEVDGISNILAYNLFVSSSIPDSIIPDSLLEVVKKNGHQIIMLNSVYDVASEESNSQVDTITSIIKQYDNSAYLTGEAAMYNDLVTITKTDFAITNIISVAAIFILIALLFKSFSIPILLIFTIELAIFINESISTVIGTNIPFIAPTFVSCIQLGATVDYAILLTSRFREELSSGKNKFDAIVVASKTTMNSVVQSASIFFFATFGVYLVSSLEIVGTICSMLARGALISGLSIILFLSPLLYTFEGFINKFTKNWISMDLINNRIVSKDVTDFDDLTFVDSYDFSFESDWSDFSDE